ncbi:unnamed protein product [Brassicogethes aeneus]|uniref:Cilia- and flagella-associated protein 157 n=1 Tax=Brassicogethes aeneus TaxID=1431903 RepID=A0A9P0B3Q5_BRAAE|nr:unnamed protein product [Brassicogethes aeneus]
MPPKKGKKGKKGKKKEPKVKEVDPRLDLPAKLAFEAELVELNRELARLRTLHLKLDQEAEECKKNLEEKGEDKDDIIVFLKRTIAERSEDIEYLTSIKTEKETLMKQETEKYDAVIDEMVYDFNTMQNELNADNDSLENRITAMEDVRQFKMELMTKFKKLEDDLEDQEIRHEKEIYDLEKYVVIETNRIKNEIEDRLAQLAAEFENTSDLRLLAATNKTIKEDILLNNELDKTLKDYETAYDLFNKLRAKFKNHNLILGIDVREERVLTLTAKRQKKKIKDIVNKAIYIASLIDQQILMQIKCLSYSKQTQELQGILEEIVKDNEKLQKKLYHDRSERIMINTERKLIISENIIYKRAFKKVNIIAKRALESAFPIRDPLRILNNISKILEGADVKKLPELTDEEIKKASYKKGRFGLQPKGYIEVPTINKDVKIQTSTSLMDLVIDENEEEEEMDEMEFEVESLSELYKEVGLDIATEENSVEEEIDIEEASLMEDSRFEEEGKYE